MTAACSPRPSTSNPPGSTSSLTSARTLQIDVAIPIDAERGRYHGLLLVAGLPNAAYPITVEVADEASEP